MVCFVVEMGGFPEMNGVVFELSENPTDHTLALIEQAETQLLTLTFVCIFELRHNLQQVPRAVQQECLSLAFGRGGMCSTFDYDGAVVGSVRILDSRPAVCLARG
jgi:hypothetical protein